MASVIIDRLLGLQAVAIAGCLGVLLISYPVPEVLRQVTLVSSLLMVVVSVGGFSVMSLPGPCRSWCSDPGPVWRRFESVVRFAAYRSRTDILWRVAALSLVVQVVRVLIAWVIGRDWHSLPFAYYWVFMPLNILLTLCCRCPWVGLACLRAPWCGRWHRSAFLPPRHSFSLLFTIAGAIGNLPGASMWSDARASPRRRLSGLNARLPRARKSCRILWLSMAQVYAAKYLAKAALSAPRDLVRAAVAKYTPLHPTVFIFHCTFVCDAQCEMCSNWTRGDRKTDMTLDQIDGPSVPACGRTSRTPRCRAASRPHGTTWSTSAA